MTTPTFFEICNVTMAKDYKDNIPTYVFFRQGAIDLMTRRNALFAYMSMHSTSMDKSELLPESPLVDFIDKSDAFAFISDFESMHFNRPIFERFFDGQFRVRVGGHTQKLVSGRYLTLILFSPSREHLDNISLKTSNRIINSIRLTYGISSASPPVYEAKFNRLEDKLEVSVSDCTFPEEIGSGEDFVYLAKIIKSRSAESNFPILNHDADILLSRASMERDPEMRFLFLWLCLDCMAKGNERLGLFQRKLSSMTASHEINRLRDLRNSIAHGQKAEITFKDCTSALWAIQVVVCPNNKIQKELCHQYETWIGSQVKAS